MDFFSPGFRETGAVILLDRFSVSLFCISPPSLPHEFLGLLFLSCPRGFFFFFKFGHDCLSINFLVVSVCACVCVFYVHMYMFGGQRWTTYRSHFFPFTICILGAHLRLSGLVASTLT